MLCKRLEVGLDPPGHENPGVGVWGAHASFCPPLCSPHFTHLDQPGAGHLRAQGMGCEDTKKGLCRETYI